MEIKSDNVAGVLAVAGGVVNKVGGLLEDIGIISKGDDHGHQRHLAELWNSAMNYQAMGNVAGYTSKMAEFKAYYNSWISGGFGKTYVGHINHLKELYPVAQQSKNPADIAAFNTYLQAFVGGVASPMTPEMFGFSYLSETTGKPLVAENAGFANIKNLISENPLISIGVAILLVLIIRKLFF